MVAVPAKKLVVSPTGPRAVHGSAAGTPGSTATGRQTKSSQGLVALRRSTTTPTGMLTRAAALN